MFELIGEWHYHPAVREAFRTGDLADRWMGQYPEIFDELDRAQVASQPNNHFYEWMAAVFLREGFGLLSLVEKYEFGKHVRKQRVLSELMPRSSVEVITCRPAPCQAPDLLVYTEDRSDWFFVEVKGPKDRLRTVQVEYFQRLQEETGRPVRLVKLRESRRGRGGV